MKVAVCDCGAGNVRSVLAAFARLGADAFVAETPSEVAAADLAVLPGVGSAASAMTALSERGLDEALRARVACGNATLGICLGLQLALERTDEDGGVTGLGLLPGRAVRLREGRVPRIGWAPVELGAAYSQAGADELVFLDVKATLEGRPALLALVERVAERLAVPFTVGGGVPA